MNKKDAIESLKTHLVKLNDTSIDKDIWRMKTGSLIADYFGKESTQYAFITQFFWDNKRDMYGNWTRTTEAEKVLLEKGIKQFINDCIDIINLKGLYKPKGNNFMSLWTNKIAIGALLSSFAIGLFIGALIGFQNVKELLVLLRIIKQ